MFNIVTLLVAEYCLRACIKDFNIGLNNNSYFSSVNYFTVKVAVIPTEKFLGNL